jgi:dihydrofolate reductase
MVTGHVFIATSLDGFIARSDGGLDWLLSRDDPGEDHGYDAFLKGMDGIVMGRGSFEAVRALGVPWPYPKPVVVLSRSLAPEALPPDLRGHVEVTPEPPRPLCERLARQGWRRVYVDGGAVIRSFLAEGLIADMVLTRIPVLIGQGLPLFGSLPADLPLRHDTTHAYPSGLVQSRYLLDPPA